VRYSSISEMRFVMIMRTETCECHFDKSVHMSKSDKLRYIYQQRSFILNLEQTFTCKICLYSTDLYFI